MNYFIVTFQYFGMIHPVDQDGSMDVFLFIANVLS